MASAGPAETSGTEGIFTAGLPHRAIEFRLHDSGRRDHIANQVRDRGLAAYEAGMPCLVASLLAGERGFVLDVGANTGLFSLLAAAASPAVKVCAFEPLASIREILEANLAINPALANRVSVHPIGLSETAGTFEFYETVNRFGLLPTSSSLEIDHVVRIGDYRTHHISTDTLDHWAQRLGQGHISFIKIDVEGHEHAVLNGGRNTILHHRPFLTIEVLSPTPVNLIQNILVECDYLDFVIVDGCLRYCDQIRHHGDGWNHLLCPAEQAARILHTCQELGLRLEIA